ncbi:hypothetical protein I8748_19610 [Nostoc sp. CENA67]|uniref:Uncharacterized protein n=1 Tax=Amazonocrinis nigriterrae CENA67 TaxID=2794033 RepID=A0A8J7LC58_9NOST|nr:hypothetical protein [Amazonocrinis nigriterrae]MBH8564366.1 hypothetical protein [Amazonocrinis nigriterrae CENA67]
MTSREDEIKKLIADIDNLLTSSGKRLPRLLSSQAQEPREVLERIRNFLVQLEQNEALKQNTQNKSAEQPQRSPLLTKFIEQGHNQPEQEQGNLIPQQLKSEFSTLLQPLQTELAAMLQERANLVQEIRQLEQRRLHHHSLSQQWANQEQMISEFLQVLMNRLVPNLTPEMTQTLANSSHVSTASNHESSELTSSATQPLESSPQVERLTQLARELDQRLLSLDGTVNVVFEALQRNINTYHESLSQALARMHSTGVQGEQLMANFLNNLTQYFQQQSVTPQPSVQEVKNETLPPSPSQPTKTTTVTNTSTKVASQPLEFLELEASPALPSYEEELSDRVNQTEEVGSAIAQDFEALVLEFDPDAPLSSNNATTPAESHLDSLDLIGDEVDQLYASLFGNSSLTNPSQQVNPEVVPENLASSNIAEVASTPDTNPEQPKAVTEDSSASSIPNTPPVSANDPVQSVDSAEILQDPWLHKPDIDLFELSDTEPEETQNAPIQSINSPLESWQTLQFEEDTDPTPPVSFSNLLEQESLATNSYEIQPSNADTITTLTDLLTDALIDTDLPSEIAFGNEKNTEVTSPSSPSSPSSPLLNASQHEEQLPEVSPPVKVPSVTIITKKLEVPINQDEKQEQLSDNYIPASPQENLLSPEVNQPTNVPDIFLDEEQLQQLHQDLAKFDQQLHFELEPASSLDSSESLSDRQNLQHPISPTNLEFPREQQIVENIPNVAFSSAEVSKIAAISLPQTPPDLDLNQISEKKKAAITSFLENSLTANSPSTNNPEVAPNTLDSVWYLGIDLGTTGISATLLNRSNFVVYPIYWSAENQAGASSFQQSFRLPAEVYLPAASVNHSETESTQALSATDAGAVAESAEKVNTSVSKNIYSAQLKPYLQIAVPYKSRQQKWEPVLQFNDLSAGPLIWVVRSLSKLLLTLKSDRHSTTQGLIATAIGLEAQTFDQIINNIAGVICTCPSQWSEQYRFNVREALLTSKLVQHPQQVFFVEEAIASLLSILDGSNGETVQISEHQGLRPVKTSDRPVVGNTLAINIGATATEMALVDLPENLLQLTHQDFMLHGFAYASKGIEQDIICQLLVPPKYRQSRFENQGDSNITSNPWQWQAANPGLDQMHWQSLRLEELDLPRVGEPDITARIRLQQYLESSVLGQAVLDAALSLKLILQHQDAFTLELADQRWVLQRRDLETQVFVPFVRRLNRELNKLLVARGIPTEAINQAILTGGVASLGVVNSWLRQKLPNAKIIQDFYRGENGAPNCSRVAYGLAMLPLHPQVLDEPRQQYTDYFLFTELLRLLPNRTLSFNEVLQLFESRGINTSICQQRLLAFLEGELPPGLIPASSDATWLTQSSYENSDYQAIAAAPLFEKQGNLTYRPNSQQMLTLRHYLDAIKASIQQSLSEPYTVNFVLEITH